MGSIIDSANLNGSYTFAAVLIAIGTWWLISRSLSASRSPDMAESTMSKISSTSKASSSSSSSKYESEMTVDEQNRLPSQSLLDKAGELPILDGNGRAHDFRSLWDRKEPTERRNIVIFIRHFFCGSCQEYVRSLSAQLSPPGLYLRNPPTTLTVIGCGDPSLILEYIAKTNCKYDVYTDPTRALYLALGMTSNLSLGDKKPDYIKKSFAGTVVTGILDTLSNPTASPGKKSQNGGEWIFVDGELRWCRRMKNTRDHIEVEELKKILDSQKETGDRDGKYAEVYRDSMAVAGDHLGRGILLR